MYGDYDTQENKDGTFTAFEPDDSKEIISANTEDELHVLMSKLEVAYCNGVVDGIKEQKDRLRNALGL